MPKYFIDTEFLEGKQDKTIFGIKYGETKPTIDLISVGIVAEDGRELYLISKDFNLKEAWNRYDLVINKNFPAGSEYNKVYWIRENVLKPIYNELCVKEFNDLGYNDGIWSYLHLKELITIYGKSNKQIAEEILWFCAAEKSIFETDGLGQEVRNRLNDNPVKFYGYYSDYDWVVFCWLFGKMNDLPVGFPMYAIDLKQELDNAVILWANKLKGIRLLDFEFQLKYFKEKDNFPKQTNEHSALSDAKWNKELYEFLNKL